MIFNKSNFYIMLIVLLPILFYLTVVDAEEGNFVRILNLIVLQKKKKKKMLF